MNAYTTASFGFSAFGAVVLILCLVDAIPREASLIATLIFGLAVLLAVAGIIYTKP